MKRQVMNVLVCIFLCGVIGNVDAYASPAASAIAKMKEAAEQQEEVLSSEEREKLSEVLQPIEAQIPVSESRLQELKDAEKELNAKKSNIGRLNIIVFIALGISIVGAIMHLLPVKRYDEFNKETSKVLFAFSALVLAAGYLITLTA